MKRLLLLLALCLILAAPVMASFIQNFQDGTGYTNCIPGGSCVYVKNTTGGNSYMRVTDGSGVINTNPEQTTYIAFSGSLSDSSHIELTDANMNVIAYYYYGGDVLFEPVEIVVTGGKVYFYSNGVYPYGFGGGIPVGVNPSHVKIAFGNIDNLIYGSSAQRVAYGMPEDNVFVIKKDMLNSAASGVAFKTNGTVVSSTYMTTTWSKSAIGATGGINDTLVLANVFSGTVYAQKYTGTKNASTEYWNILTALVNSGAPYGWYETYLLNETGVHSSPINYIGTGASVSFDRDAYSQQDIATITHAVADGGYWNTGLYNYKLAIMNGNTGQFVHNESIAVQSGTSTHTFTSSDTQGVYYAVIIATDLSTGADVWMNYDWADVSGYVTFTGYVNGAETNAVLSGANVSIVQGSTVVNQVTIADGNYTFTGGLLGTPIEINATATGYSQYLARFSPGAYGTTHINITLNSTTPSYTGLGIGGVVREGVFDGTTITKGYGRPMAGASCWLQNTTYAESYTNVSNNAGWYQADEGNSVFLTTGRLYDVWCSRLGYSNSPNYTVAAA